MPINLHVPLLLIGVASQVVSSYTTTSRLQWIGFRSPENQDDITLNVRLVESWGDFSLEPSLLSAISNLQKWMLVALNDSCISHGFKENVAVDQGAHGISIWMGGKSFFFHEILASTVTLGSRYFGLPLNFQVLCVMISWKFQIFLENIITVPWGCRNLPAGLGVKKPYGVEPGVWQSKSHQFGTPLFRPSSGWWQLKYFDFLPKDPWERIQFGLILFQMGWNQQLYS